MAEAEPVVPVMSNIYKTFGGVPSFLCQWLGNELLQGQQQSGGGHD